MKQESFNNNFNHLRLIAAVQVLLVHSFNHLGYDNIFIKALKIIPGVPIFFFISGFLIGGTFIRNHKKGLLIFAENRILRLYPALVVCFIFSLALVFVSGYFQNNLPPVKSFLLWVASQLTFFQFYNPTFMREFGVGVLNGSLWTIVVEIQFYFLTPILFYSIMNRKKVFLIIIILISILINLYLRIYPNWNELHVKLMTISFLPWIYMFLLGFLINSSQFIKTLILKQNLYLIVTLYVLSMVFIGEYEINAMNSINPISVCLLIIIVYKLAFIDFRIPSIFYDYINQNDISYGIYIYHMPIINYFLYINYFPNNVNLILVLSLVFSFSFLSWKFIEKPLLLRKK